MANALFNAHRDDCKFGYRFLADEARDRALHPGDVVPMESVFALLQRNVLDDTPGSPARSFGRHHHLDRTDHHRRRRQDRLGRMTPVVYETIVTTPAAHAVPPNLSPDRAGVSAPDPRRQVPSSARARPSRTWAPAPRGSGYERADVTPPTSHGWFVAGWRIASADAGICGRAAAFFTWAGATGDQGPLASPTAVG